MKRCRRSMILPCTAGMLSLFAGLCVFALDGAAQESTNTTSSTFRMLPSSELPALTSVVSPLSIAEWLGPMAPLALSPFFGITCMSGLALFGGEWFPGGSALLGKSSPMHSPVVFGVFAILTVLTSVPRFTKVSKPFAQAVDQLETWSGIITMLIMKFLLSNSAPQAAGVAVIQAGFLTIPADVLLAVAAGMNVFVISAVRFFFEVLIWLTPIPFLDAAFEVSNKLVCAGLMFVYAWSPVAALSVNLTVFAVSLIVFGWVHRREVFFRTMLFDALRSLISRPVPTGELQVFPVGTIGAIKPGANCRLVRIESGHWQLRQKRWLRRDLTVAISCSNPPVIQPGLFSCSLTFSDPAAVLTFSRLYRNSLPQLAEQLGAKTEQQATTLSAPAFL